MSESRLLSSFAIVFGLFSMCYAETIGSCSTPTNQIGECKAITDCPSVLALLAKRPIGSHDADYIKRSECGLEGDMNKVCCPLKTQPLTTPKPILPNITDVDSPLLPSLDVCGVETQDRISGGITAGLREFPWMCLVEYERDDKKRGFYCGGVLINSRYILTAAHCVKGRGLPKSWKLVSVRLGEYNTKNETDCVFNGFVDVCAPPPLNVPVEETIVHEEYEAYDTNQYHDIALLRLATNVSFSAQIKPICLPKSAFDQSKNFSGQKLMVAGWGKTENGTESSVKLKLYLPVMDISDCSQIYTEAGVNIHEAQICAGGVKYKDSCKGDSGGPLMSYYANKNGITNWYSIGVVSTGPSPCGKEGWPGVYARVAKYVPWIISKLKP